MRAVVLQRKIKFWRIQIKRMIVQKI